MEFKELLEDYLKSGEHMDFRECEARITFCVDFQKDGKTIREYVDCDYEGDVWSILQQEYGKFQTGEIIAVFDENEINPKDFSGKCLE